MVQNPAQQSTVFKQKIQPPPASLVLAKQAGPWLYFDALQKFRVTDPTLGN
jgi:hypothetical protein